MKTIFTLVFIIFAFSFSTFAQDMKGEKEPTEKDKTEAIPTNAYLKRGAPIGNSQKVRLSDALADPAKYAGQTIVMEGIVVRSCKAEGCWAELAPNKDGKSVRVKMKDHAFFIPLQSAGALARVEGTLVVKKLTKAQVDHMIKEDGAKFDKRNADGTVSEVSFEATGIELKKTAN